MRKLILGVTLLASISSLANDSIFFCMQADTQLEAIQKMNVGFATNHEFSVDSLKSRGLVMKKEDVTSKSQLTFVNNPRSQGFSKDAVVCVTVNGKLSNIEETSFEMPDKPPF